MRQPRTTGDDDPTLTHAKGLTLFVYGTLMPGQPNAHLLEAIGGHFEPGTVRGRVRFDGAGSARGYPGLELDPDGDVVEGFVFVSERLAHHWPTLDDFEGGGYVRGVVTVDLDAGDSIDAHAYLLRSRCH